MKTQPKRNCHDIYLKLLTSSISSLYPEDELFSNSTLKLQSLTRRFECVLNYHETIF